MEKGKFTVVATLGMSLGQSTQFNSYEEASDFAGLLLVGQPPGQVEVVKPDGTVIWSYTRALK